MFKWIDKIYIPFVKTAEVKFLILFGFFFRALFFTLYFTITKWPDSWSFMELVPYLMKFNLSGYTGERSPGYPLLIALGGGTMRLTIVYQFVIGVVTSVIQYKLLLKLGFQNKNALWIAVYLETLLYVFFYETAILIESLTVFLLSAVFYILADNYFNKRDLKSELLFSLLLGYLVLTKPFFAYIPFVIYGFSVLYRFHWKKIINQKIIILIFPLLAYFGWSYVNKVNTGYFVSTTYFGLNISQNCVYFAEKGPEKYRWIIDPYVKYREETIREKKDVAMAIWHAHYHDLQHKYPYFPECSYYLGEYAKETIKNNQYDYWKQVVTRSWLDFWRVKIYWDFEKVKLKPLVRTIWRLQKITLYFFKWSFLALVPFFVFRFFKKRKITFEIVAVTIIFAGSLLQGIVTYGTNVKYAYPYEFLMIIVVLLFFKKEVKLPRRISTFLQ